MHNLPFSTSPSSGRFGAPMAAPPDSLQTSYFLVNEDGIGASPDGRSRPHAPAIPARHKPSPTVSSPASPPKPPPQEFDTANPSSRATRSNVDCNILRRESTQTVRPLGLGLTTPDAQRGTSSSIRSPSVPESSVAISDMSCSISRRDSPVASFSEYPLSRSESFLENIGADQPRDADLGASRAEQQLIMPLIALPQRRGFTKTGKEIGALKILVAGGKGTGKTSLIKAMLQCCEHVVHVGPTKAVPVKTMFGKHSPSEVRADDHGGITETLASTMPRPAWWSPCEDEKPLGEEEDSSGAADLDTNICFVDTPGHDTASSSPSSVISQVHEYIELHLRPHLSSAVADADMLKMLGGSGGSLISTVLYLLPPTGITKEDTQFLLALQRLTNVIPVVSHADTLSVEEVAAIKETVSHELASSNIKPFTFGVSGTSDDTPAVYAVSSAPGSEFDLTDASLLVNSEYIQPLVTTDLARLVDDIFCPNGASWLRHSAAKTFLHWRRRHTPFGHGLDLCLAPRLTVEAWAQAGIQRWRESPRLNGDDNGELLDNWAAALRRSLNRGGGLSGQPPENLLQLARPASLAVARRQRGRAGGRRAKVECSPHQDPLGLLQVLGEIRHHGQSFVEVVGTVGVLGTFGVWMWWAGGAGA